MKHNITSEFKKTSLPIPDPWYFLRDKTHITMSQATTSIVRKVAKQTLIGVGGATALTATALTAYTNTESGAGFRREVRFWQKVAPVVADYYIQTGESSPLVKYQRWKATNDALQGKKEVEVLEELHKKHAPDIMGVMLELKGLYVKLGQVLSVTALPIPEAYRVLFRTLQSDVPGWEEFEKVIKPTLEQEFGNKPLEEIFEYIDPIPCGAASVGQAHKAKLKHISKEVIVKVQYPDAKWQVPADIECVGDFLKICVWFGVVDEQSSKLSFDEFSRQFISELNYNQERENLKRVYESSLDPTAPYIKRNVVIPAVYDEFCTDKVITMTYLPGPKLEAEAKKQLEALGIDTSKGIAEVVRDAA
eukprot:9290407-Ditylum_brightwellii.AAC.1